MLVFSKQQVINLCRAVPQSYRNICREIFRRLFPLFRRVNARINLQYLKFVVFYLSCLLSKHLVAGQTVWRIRLVVYGARLESVLV